MASKRMNVLVYSGAGSTVESVRHCLYSLRRLLSPNYAVLPITGDVIIKEPWAATCALLVMPGGADLPYCRTLNGEGNRRIKQYVYGGGAYAGFCAGGYYASKRCEFEIGDEKMEVNGERELQFFPDVCRGTAFPGFQYNSESGTRAAELKIEKSAFSLSGVLPEVFKSYSNGGGVYVNAARYKDRGVEVLANYTEKLSVDSGEGAAAAVFCKVGDGYALLTGSHPEFATVNLSIAARNIDEHVVAALTEDDKQRTVFLKACLMKLGLQVNQEEQVLPSLSPLHFTSFEESGVTKVLSKLDEVFTHTDDEDYIKSEHDTFHLERRSAMWSLSGIAKAAAEVMPGTADRQNKKDSNTSEDKILDYDKIVKNIIAYETGLPSAQDTPYFNHQTYYENLEAYSNSSSRSSSRTGIGRHLMHAEVVTSTSTLLDKNPTLTSRLPTGTTLTATTQLTGRGRGSNVWISPAGSLMFSFLLRHPLALNATAPVVFIQYLAALAVAEGVHSYSPRSNTGYRDLPVKLKWPNDIYALDPSKPGADAADRNAYTKIGGILVNSSYAGGDYTLVVGIGLNVSNAAPTTSLNAVLDAFNRAHAKGRAPLPAFGLEKLLARILTRFEELYGTFCREGFGGELERLYYRHWLHEGQVVVLEMEGGARARIKGITSDWGLLKAEEVTGEGDRGTGRMFALQTDSNSFDFFKGLLKRKV